MGLQEQNLALYFARGIDRKTDDYQVLATKLLTLENGILISPKQFKKRNGYQLLGTQLDGGFMSSSFLSELVVEDGLSLQSYSASLMDWVNKGRIQNISLNTYPVVRNTYQQTYPDCAVHPAGIEIYTWEDTQGGAHYSVVDSRTKQSITQNQQISSTSSIPKPMVVGNYIIIVYEDDDNLNFLAFSVLTPSVAQGPYPLSLTFDDTDPIFDACSLDNKVYVAYNDSSGAISINFVDANLNVSAKRTIVGEMATESITCFADQTLLQLWVAWCDGTDMKYTVYDNDLAISEILPVTDIDNVPDAVNMTGYADNGLAQLYYQIFDSTPSEAYINEVSLDNTGTVGTPDVFILSVGLKGKAFSFEGIRYVPVAYESELQSTYFLLDENHNVMLKWAPTNGGGLGAKTGLPETNLVGESTFYIASLIKDLLTTISGVTYTQTGVNSYQFDLSPDDAPQKIELGQNLLITGGILYMYDGLSVVEHNFHIFPENVTGSVDAGGSLSAGQYQYQVVYEWTDNQGQIHRSAPSVPLTKTVALNNKVILTIPTLRLTAKTDERAPVEIVIYRTEANGTVFYRITSVTSPLLNNPAANTVTYEDTAADSTIIGNSIIYTTGGVVENTAAPCPKSITQFKDRAIVIPAESQLSWWYSKEVVPGTPVEFSDLFVNNVDRRGGNITTTAQLDEKLVFLKPEGILYVVGDGPNATGGQNNYSEAQIIPNDNGCTDLNSVVVMPDGLMYKSEKGIYLLDRSLSTFYVGAGVESYNEDRVLSATTVPNTTQARFILETGVALVYDYYMKGGDKEEGQGVGQWSVFTNHRGSDACVFQGQYTFITPAGKVMQETPGVFNDNGAFIKLKAVTAWMSFAGMQGFQRIWQFLIIGHYKSPHLLRIRVGYNFNSTFIQDKYINPTEILDPEAYGDVSPYGEEETYGGQYPLYQWRINNKIQKCQSIRIGLEDSQSNPIGEGMAISSISAIVGVKKGLNKLSAARRS